MSKVKKSIVSITEPIIGNISLPEHLVQAAVQTGLLREENGKYILDESHPAAQTAPTLGQKIAANEALFQAVGDCDINPNRLKYFAGRTVSRAVFAASVFEESPSGTPSQKVIEEAEHELRSINHDTLEGFDLLTLANKIVVAAWKIHQSPATEDSSR
jgi:hypothetical protein